MAKKKRPRRPAASRGRAARTSTQAPGPAAPNAPRRDRKEQVRQAKEAARKRAQRAATARRALWFSVVGLTVVTVVFFIQRAAAPKPIPPAAIKAAKDANCTGVQTPDSGTPDRSHLSPGASYTYSQHPATSGPHDPSPLSIPPHVYTAPISETNAVHNLEHAAVLLYYRQSGDGSLPADVVAALAKVANTSSNTILAPYPDLPTGEAFALAAWNKLQTCPSGVTASQAATIARGFITAFQCTRNAPEAKNGNGC